MRIRDENFLENLPASNLLVAIGRIALFFQMLTVFPLLVYIIRVQSMRALFGKIYPSFLHCFVLHVLLLATCILFAMFVPNIGTIVRYANRSFYLSSALMLLDNG
ncbi:unnamed protein product [Protopolystoma xenopodis]|uniref:Uncharacterized protein n=1 Tax=Protopolystoma xenopodis TaxID=117903 RepID=A0A448WUV2_9PLAT|nr:unnamed protein product [Protopolystoma xenopodis]